MSRSGSVAALATKFPQVFLCYELFCYSSIFMSKKRLSFGGSGLTPEPKKVNTSFAACRRLQRDLQIVVA